MLALLLTAVRPLAAAPTDSVPTGFDVPGYCARNSDIASTYANHNLGAWQHFYNFGLGKGRQFDTQFVVDEYLLLNADLMHWLFYGRAEDRIGRVPVGFNVAAYLARYPDLQASFAAISPTALRHLAVWQHYLDYGVREGLSDGDFEAYAYLAMNTDLAAGYGDRIAVLTTNKDAPAPQTRYVFNLDTRRWANGDYEIFVLATNN